MAMPAEPRGGRCPIASLLPALIALTALAILVAQAVAPLRGWDPGVGINLVADQLSTLMLSVSSAVTLAVLVYSVAQGAADGDDGASVAIFHPTCHVLSAGVSNAFLSGDLFNLYVGFEMLLAASFVLLTLGGGREQVRAGMTYVVISLIASTLFVTALALVYAATGTVNMADLSGKIGDLPVGVREALAVLLLVVFGIKAGLFPLFSWLPDSYPVAPSAVTAVFAGLLTKVGVYVISGFCAALAGLLFSLYILSGNSLHAIGMELDAIAAVVIGGTLLTGGRGYVVGSLLGVLVLGIIKTLISFDGTLSSYWIRIITGVLLLAFVVVQRFATRRRP